MKNQNLLTRLKILIIFIAVFPSLVITLLVYFISMDTITHSLSGFGIRMKSLNQSSQLLTKITNDELNLIADLVEDPSFIKGSNEEKARIIKEKLGGSAPLQEIFYYNQREEREFAVELDSEKIHSSYFDNQWIKSALNGHFNISQVFFQNDEPWINYSIPVFDKEIGMIAGVLSVNISLSGVFQAIEPTFDHSNTITYVVDDKGKVIYVSGDLQPVFSDITLGTKLDIYQMGGFDIEKQQDIFYLVSMSRIENLGWLMVSKSRMTDIALTTQRLTTNLLGAFFLSFLFSLLLSSYVARHISKPLEDLTQITRDIAGGDYTKEVPIKRASDEIGELTTSFEDMRQKLKKFTEENKEIYSRTKARLERRVMELRTIHTATEVFAQINSLPELQNYIVNQIQNVLSGKFCNLYLKDEKGIYKLQASADIAEGNGTKYSREELPINEEPYCEVQKSLKALIVHNPYDEEWLQGIFPEGEVGGYCVFPLFVSNKLFGVIEYGTHKDGDLTEGSIRLLTTLAKEASISIENAKLYQRMAKDKDKIETIFAAISDGVVTMNSKGIITSFNKAAESITGYPRNTVIGKPCKEIFIGISESGAAEKKVFCKETGCLICMASEQGQSLLESEHIVTTPTGKKKTLEFSTTIDREEIDESITFVSVFRDISKIREIEKLRTDFIDTMSHELRTPLTSIKGYVSSLLHPRAKFTDEEIKDFLAIINDETNHLNRMINDLLEASKLNRHSLIIKPRPFDMKHTTENIIKKFEGTTSKHSFVVDMDEDPKLFGDPGQVEFVLNHLLENAVKFSPQGGIIKVSMLPAEQNNAMIIVEDEGVGVPLEHREKIFDLFHRVDNRNTRRIYGPGIGLFISKKIVEAHEGKIWVESGLQGGSKFVFTLPKHIKPSIECEPEQAVSCCQEGQC